MQCCKKDDVFKAWQFHAGRKIPKWVRKNLVGGDGMMLRQNDGEETAASEGDWIVLNDFGDLMVFSLQKDPPVRVRKNWHVWPCDIREVNRWNDHGCFYVHHPQPKTDFGSIHTQHEFEYHFLVLPEPEPKPADDRLESHKLADDMSLRCKDNLAGISDAYRTAAADYIRQSRYCEAITVLDLSRRYARSTNWRQARGLLSIWDRARDREAQAKKT